MSTKEDIADALEMDPDDVTKSFLFLTGTFLLYGCIGAITVVPSWFAPAFAVLFVIFWLGSPVALYFDRKHVAHTSEWDPSKLYYLGFLPGYLGVAVLGYYLYKRTGWYRSTLTGRPES